MHIHTKIVWLLTLTLLVTAVACKQDPKPKAPAPEVTNQRKVPSFSADSTYKFVEEQLAFGYRYPGSEGQQKMISYLSGKLESYGAKVVKQDFQVDFLGKTDVTATNVIGSFNPELEKRVLLCAHWDSRLIAEKDEDEERQDDPIMGADDGATGTAALLEIARLIKENGIDIGIDIVLFDAEDQGNSDDEKSWCLGSQYWSKNPHVPNYKAKYGILLDMVGAKDARFGREYFSTQFAKPVLDKVWKLAQAIGYGDYFQDYDAGGVTDDHYYVNTILRIPTIDIINRPVGTTKHGFGHYHHTHKDDIDIVDKRTLKVVGQVVTAVIYNESNGKF